MTAVSAAALLLRRFRSEGAILLLLFVLVASTSFLFAAAPRLFNRVTDDAIRYAASTATAVDRDVWLSANGTIQPGTDPGAGALTAYGEEREADFPASIDRLISDRFQGATSVRFTVPQSIVALSLRYQAGLTDASRLVAGQWPVDGGLPLQMIPTGQLPAAGNQTPTVFQAALSTAQADVIGAHVGDHFNVALDGSDPLAPKSPITVGGGVQNGGSVPIAPTEVEVVGIYEPLDTSAPEWSGSSLLQPSYKQGPAGIEAIYATVYIPAETYSRLAASSLPFHYDWHYVVDPARVDADQVGALQLDLQRLALLVSPTDGRALAATSSAVALNSVSLRTGLLGIVDGFLAERALSEIRPVDSRAGLARARRRSHRYVRDPARPTPARRIAPGTRPRGIRPAAARCAAPRGDHSRGQRRAGRTGGRGEHRAGA